MIKKEKKIYFNNELTGLKESLTKMANLVEEAIGFSGKGN